MGGREEVAEELRTHAGLLQLVTASASTSLVLILISHLHMNGHEHIHFSITVKTIMVQMCTIRR